MEHRFRLVQEEKNRMELDAKEKQDERSKKSTELEGERSELKENLKKLENDIREHTSDLIALKSLLEDKNAEISRLRKGLTDMGEEENRIRRSKRTLEEDMKAAQNGRIIAERKKNNLMEQRERLSKAKEVEEGRLHSSEKLSVELNGKLVDLQETINEIERQCVQTDKDIETINHLKRQAKEEADLLIVKNSQLRSDKENILKKIEDFELQFRVTNRKLGDISTLITDKDKELESIRTATTYTETKVLTTTEELRKVKTENETLEVLLRKYRDDVEFHKRLRDEEAIQKYRLEEERKRLSHETLMKNIEAQAAKKELERYQDSHYQLLEEKSLVAQELETIRDHASLLESQNQTVLSYYHTSLTKNWIVL